MAEASAQQKYKKKQREKGLCACCPTPATNWFCDYHARKNKEYKRSYRERHPRTRTRQPLHAKSWVRELLSRESFTATEAGDLAGLWGRDAVDRLRQSSTLDLIVLGRAPNAKHYRTALYKVRLRNNNKA